MKAYTYNDRLVGVGNDQILGTDQGGGSTYTAGNGIDITNDVISVDDTVALASALPTTELGKFTIQNNVSGGPIEVIIPIDQGHAVYTVLMDSNNVSGTYEPSGGYKGVLFKSPGYDNDYWNYSAGTVTMHVPEAVTGIANIYACYASNSNPTASYGTGPGFFSNYPWYNPDTSTYTLLPGDYEIATRTNQVPESAGGYGKYISVVANGPGPDLNALSKISFAGMERHPELGYDVNLNRYELGNTNTTTSTSNLTQAPVYIDPVTKKRTVYLPSSMPSNWAANSNIAQAFEYGNSYVSPSNSNYSTKQYRAYKYTSSPTRYQFAYCTDWDAANKLMTFVAYDNSGDAIEKWTLDYTTYGSNVWTTTPISSGSTYTAGDYISIENDEIAVTGVGNLVAGNNITITESGNNITISAADGGSTYTAGQYISIDSNDEISVTGLAPVSGSDGITVNDNVVSLDTPVEIVAGDNIEITVTGVSAIISAQGGGGTIYTPGNGIDITNDIISVDNTVALKTDIPVVTGYATHAEVNTVSGAIVNLIPAAPVQSNWNETNTSSLAYINNKPNLSNYVTTSAMGTAIDASKATYTRVTNSGTTNLSQLTTTGVGAGKLTVNLSSIFNTSYSMIEWAYCDTNVWWGDTKSAYWFTLSARLNNVVATQWASVSNAIQLKTTGAVFMSEIFANCGNVWNPIDLVVYTDSAWTSNANVIRRDIRNSSTIDNNTYHLWFSGYIYVPA